METIYDFLYDQSVANADPRTWQFQIRYQTQIIGCDTTPEGKVLLSYHERGSSPIEFAAGEAEYDIIIAATGYNKHEHEKILSPLQGLLDGAQGRLSIGSDSQVNFRSGIKRKDTGIWLLQPLADALDVS